MRCKKIFKNNNNNNKINEETNIISLMLLVRNRRVKLIKHNEQSNFQQKQRKFIVIALKSYLMTAILNFASMNDFSVNGLSYMRVYIYVRLI